MREILFKAKRIDDGEWIIGNLVVSEDAEEGWKAIIIPTFDSNIFTKGGVKGDLGFENWHRVDENTVCQYTGYEDDSGNKIFENDLIECKEFSKGLLIKHFLSQVEWDDTGTGFAFKDSVHGWAFMDSLTVYECEVIGNIFDNPELLKGSEEE